MNNNNNNNDDKAGGWCARHPTKLKITRRVK